MIPYKEEFPVGSVVLIESLPLLEDFRRTWAHHNKLTAEQLQFAGQLAEVARVGFYHGGDVLYGLKGIPGAWHEQCLGPALPSERAPDWAEHIAEHNRVFKHANELIKAEIIIQDGPQLPGVSRGARARLEKGLRLLARVRELNPANWSAMWLAGKVQQRLGDQPEALKWFARAYELNPAQADLAREASLAAMALGHSDSAIQYACSAQHARPADPGLQANLAVAFLLAGRLDEARATVVLAVALDPNDTVSRTVQSMVAHFMGAGVRPPSTTAALDDYWKKHVRNAEQGDGTRRD